MKGRSFSLKPFPSDRPPPNVKITGSIGRLTNTLSLSYSLLGPLAELSIPPPAQKCERKNALWEETCFEFFLGTRGSDLYREFNLSPSGNWNVYRFTSYRKGMEEEPAFTSLPFSVRTRPDGLRLFLELDLEKIVPAEQVLQIAVSAVIKDRSGRITYWALTHPGTQPDFHRREGFIVEV
jgi:hypothetical protein